MGVSKVVTVSSVDTKKCISHLYAFEQPYEPVVSDNFC